MRGILDDIERVSSAFSTSVESGARLPQQIEKGIKAAEDYAKAQLTLQSIQTVTSVVMAIVAVAAYMREKK